MKIKKKLAGAQSDEINKLKEQLETMKKDYENDIKRIKNENYKATENLKKDYENKIQKMKADYEKKLADKDALLKSSNSNMSQALEQMKAEYEKKMTMLNGEINKFRTNFLEKEKELNKTQNRLYQYEGKVEDLTAKVKQLEDKLSKTANLSEAEKNKKNSYPNITEHRGPNINLKIYHKRYSNQREKEKSKIKNAILKKLNNDVEIVEETKITKVKDLMDNKFINEYDPEIQDNTKNPQLKFYIDCESCSESEQDLSSASISDESMDKTDSKKENSKDIYKNNEK